MRASRARLVDWIFRGFSRIYDRPILQERFYRRVHFRVLAEVTEARFVVDLGCGTAQLTHDLSRRFPKALVVGLDLSPSMLRAGLARLGPAAPPLVRANVYALPLATGSVDVLTSTVSYHWYLEPMRALAEIHRVLRPGGQFILATVVTGRLRGVLGVTRMFRAEDVARELEHAGFDVRSNGRAISSWPRVQLLVGYSSRSRNVGSASTRGTTSTPSAR